MLTLNLNTLTILLGPKIRKSLYRRRLKTERTASQTGTPNVTGEQDGTFPLDLGGNLQITDKDPKSAKGTLYTTNEPSHDKTNKMTVRPAKTQITLIIRPV